MDDVLPTTTPSVSAPAGQTVRFEVASADGRRSGTWVVWTSKNDLDVYVALRGVAGTFKVSLHKSGSWQLGFTSAGAVPWGLSGPGRHLQRWQKPADIGPGVVRAFSIVIPDAELRSRIPLKVPRKPIVQVPAPGRGFAAHIDLALFEPGSSVRRFTFLEPIFDVAELTRAGGGAVRVVARQAAWSDNEQAVLDASRRQALAQIDPTVLAGHPPEALRLVLMGHEADETRVAWDAAADI